MTLARIDARATEKGSLLPTRALTHLWGHDADGVGKMESAQVRAFLGSFDNEADFLAANIPPQVNSVFVYGYSEVGDGGQHEKMRVETPSSVKAWHKQSADGSWWQIVPGDIIRLEMFGAFPHIVCEAETKAWYDACATKPSYLHLMHTDRFIRRMKWRGLWTKITAAWCLAGQTQADSAINIKSPGTYNATYGGTLTFASGYGITGDGVSGYIALPAWNNLLTQDDAAIALYSIGGTTTGYVVSSNVGGSGGNITINPSDVSGNYLVRFMNNANVWGAASSKDGMRILSRRSSAGFDSYYDDEVFKRYPTATSTTLTTSTGLLLSSGLSQFSDHTVRMFVTLNDGITDIEADALSLFIRLYVDGLSGVIGKGPSCDSIGFSVRTSDTDMAAAFDTVTDFAQFAGAKVMLGYGTYLASDSYPIKGNVHTFGASRRGSIIRQTAAANNLVPVYGPRHKRGGETGSVIENLCLDGATTARGHVIGNSPGGSGISTLGTSFGRAFDLDIIEAVLHGIDLCNNGEMVGGIPKYVAVPSASKRDVGIASHDWQFKRIHLENWGDDAVTFHYSHSSCFEAIHGYFASGRIGYENSMVAEADDGCWGITVNGVYARGVPHAVGIKCHADNPPPSGVKMYDVVAEMCGRGCSIYSSAGVGVGDFGEDNHIDGLRYTRPADWAPGVQEVMPLYISNMKHVTAKNIYFSARVGDTFLWRGIYVSGSAQNVLVDGFTGLNWVVPDAGSTDGATVRVASGASDVTIRKGLLLGAGKYGVWDSGSTRADYDDIRIGGTSVASSIGFWLSSSVATAKITNRAVKVISGFATEQTIVA